MTIFITLSLAGADSGPFDLYSNVDGFTTPFNTTGPVSKANLLAGYEVTAPDGTITVRLLDLSASCTPFTTDIYTCATPNCDFAGSILCNVTTTTTAAPTTTTTSTDKPPTLTECLWSSNGGDVGQIATFDPSTGLSSVILVPNDFENGSDNNDIDKAICTTSDKLWISGRRLTDARTGDRFIREWDINHSTTPPTLSYVREIIIVTPTLPGNFSDEVQSIGVTADNNTLLVGFSDKIEESAHVGVCSWDISSPGNLTLTGSNKIAEQSTKFTQNNVGYYSNLGLFITTDNNVIVSLRVSGNPLVPADENNNGNYIKQFVGLPPEGTDENQWLALSLLKPEIKLQNIGVPEFVFGPNFNMPLWGLNGTLQVLQPETRDVYDITQEPTYTATIAYSIPDRIVWLSSSSNCANVDILNQDEVTGCIPTILPSVVDSRGENISPVSFNFEGLQLTASTNLPEGMASPGPGNEFTVSQCGIIIPGFEEGQPFECAVLSGNVSTNLDNPAADYIIDFPIPVNNIPIRISVMDTGDDFRFLTNSSNTTISLVSGCNISIQNGNEIYTDEEVYFGYASCEVIVTGSQDFTSLTILSTNLGNGTPIGMGCPVTSFECLRIFADGFPENCNDNIGACSSTNNSGEFKRIYAWNPVSAALEEVSLPAASYFNTPSLGISNNWIITQCNPASEVERSRFTRYSYDLSTTGVPINLEWERTEYTTPNFFPTVTGISVISDTKWVSFDRVAGGLNNKTLEVEIIDGSSELLITQKFENTGWILNGETLITLKTDGVTPSKLIAVGQDELGFNSPWYITQWDYTTGLFENSIELPQGVNGAKDISMIGNSIYISAAVGSEPSTIGLWSIDINTELWTKVPDLQAPITGDENSEFATGAASRPGCRVSDGFTVKVTTTTTSERPPDGEVRTIWTRFESEIND